MASSKGLGADPAYRRLIDLAQGTGDVDLVKGMEHLSHNPRLDKDFVIRDVTSFVGRAAFQALGLPREGITVRQAMVRAHAYADSRGGRSYQDFADELGRYLGLAEGSTTTEAAATIPTAMIGPDERSPYEAGAVVDINQHRIDYIEQRLPDAPASRIGADTAKGDVLIVPTHVAVVRHAAWERRWTPGATWGNRTRWANKIPLGLDSAGSIRRDLARALAAHDAHELAALAAHPGWEWVASAMPPAFGGPATDDVPAGSGSLDTHGPTRGDGGAPYRRQERQSAPQDEAKVFSRNPDLIDRGTVAHMDIQDLLSVLVESRGLAPLRAVGDPQFDLAWRDGSSVVVCEVKSLTVENEVSQLRLGLGQVLSYVYKLNWQGADEVRGVLAVEREPSDADWVNICADHGVTLTWAPDFPSLFPLGVPKEQEEAATSDATPAHDKPQNLHHRVFPYMNHFVQYANDRGPEGSPWIVRDRSTSLRNERQGRGRALLRLWAPGAWEEVIESSPQDGDG